MKKTVTLALLLAASLGQAAVENLPVRIGNPGPTIRRVVQGQTTLPRCDRLHFGDLGSRGVGLRSGRRLTGRCSLVLLHGHSSGRFDCRLRV